MKKIISSVLLLLVIQFYGIGQEESAYFEVGKVESSIPSVSETVKNSLKSSGFKIIGEYNPANSEELAVICYTSSELENIALSYTDRGALASALKIGLKKEGNLVKVSMINPMYLFYAYFIDNVEKEEKNLRNISEKAKSALSPIGSDFTAFGGTLDKKKLQKYRYKVMMPYFSNPEKINEFNSFEDGVKLIQKNLSEGKNNTEKVYELIYPEKEVAVFGVGLKNPDDGEAKFLTIIGDDHVAAMPYEIILEGEEATILPGRYRIALHWPELTMGTFMKIMSTPGDIKSTMESLTE